MALLGKGVIQLMADASGAIRNLQQVKRQAQQAARETSSIGRAAKMAVRPMSALKQVMLHAAGYALGRVAVAGIQSMVSEAVGAIATFERMEMSLTALAAKEIRAANSAGAFAQIMHEQLGATDAQVMRYQRLRSEYERVTQAIRRMTANGQTQSEYFQRLVDYQRELRHQIEAVVPGYDQLSAALRHAATGEMTMTEALKEAVPRAQELFRWTQKLAIQSPFSAEGVMNALRTAMAYGFTTREAQRLTQAMIDFASATGASENVMSQVALALGQIKAKGKLAGQEILQLVNAGVPVTDILAQMGYSLDDVSKGLVKAQDFMTAFTQYMDENFGGAAKRQAESFAGLLNTFQDIKKQGLVAFFGSMADALKPVIIGLSDWLQGPGLKQIGAWGQALGQIARGFLRVAGLVRALLSGDIGRLSGLFQKMGVPRDAQKAIFRFMVEAPRRLAAMRDRIAQVWADIRARMGPWVEETFGKIQAWWEENGPTVIAAAQRVFGWLSTVFGWLLAQVGPVVETLKPLLSGIVDLVLGVIAMIAQAINGDWAGAWATLKETAAKALADLWKALTELFDLVLGWLGSSWPEFVAMWQEIWHNLKIIVKTVLGNVVGTVKAKWGEIKTNTVNKLLDMINAAKEKWGTMKGDLETVLQDMVAAARDKVQAIYQAGVDFIMGFWDGLKEKWEAVKAWVAEKFGWILSLVRSIYNSHSPSRKMQQLGADIMEGWRLGLEQVYRRTDWARYFQLAPVTIGARLQAVAGAEVAAPTGGGRIQMVQVHLHYSPTFSLADEVEMERVLGPFVVEKVREALGGGTAWVPA